MATIERSSHEVKPETKSISFYDGAFILDFTKVITTDDKFMVEASLFGILKKLLNYVAPKEITDKHSVIKERASEMLESGSFHSTRSITREKLTERDKRVANETYLKLLQAGVLSQEQYDNLTK